MTPIIILLITNDPKVERAATNAALTNECSVRLARTSREAMRILKEGTQNVALAVVDLDPGVHGLAAIAAIANGFGSTPILALTDMEECYVQSIALGHGATECLSKPVTPARFADAIARLCAVASE